MITDVLGMTNYKKNEKEILELASKEICEQLSEELNKKNRFYCNSCRRRPQIHTL